MSKLLNFKALSEREKTKGDRVIIWQEESPNLYGVHYPDVKGRSAYAFCKISSDFLRPHKLTFKKISSRFEVPKRMIPIVFALEAEPDIYSKDLSSLQYQADKILQNILNIYDV